jgi:CDP-6-deoxy-D-xylo-4-hexulose-3-dehydrase
MFYELAYNIRPTEIVGFLGSLQLPLLPATIKRREENFRRFHTAVLSKPNDYYTLHVDHIETVSNFSMPVITKSPQILQAVTKRFESAGVEIRPVIAGDITQHPFWTNALPKANCPNARTIHSQGFYFPNNADLTDDEVSRICSLL